MGLPFGIFDHVVGLMVEGHHFTTKADARRMRDTMNALQPIDNDPKHDAHYNRGLQMRFTIKRKTKGE